MRRISICLYFLIVFNLVPAITYNLINSDVKILKIIDLSYRYNKLFLTNPSIQDLNSDGINDLFFTESYYMVSLNDYFRVFYGHKIWRPLIYEDECDIVIVDTIDYSVMDLDCGKIVNIPDEGKFLILIERAYIGVGSYPDQFFLLPTDLIPGSYNRNDVECRHYDSLVFYDGRTTPFRPHNYTVFDSFFVFPGVFRLPLSSEKARLWAFLPIDLSGDTINIVENSPYQLVIRNKGNSNFSHVIFSPGDVNGDGYNDLVFGKMAFNWWIGMNPTTFPHKGMRWAIHLWDYEQSFSSHILWGRREWHGADIISYDSSSYKYNTYTHTHHTYWVVGPEEECDLDNDGFADIILNEAMAVIFSDSTDSTPYDDIFIWTGAALRYDFGDTSKLYILFGRRDFPRDVYDSIQYVADVTIKSRYTNAGIGGAISVGDYNGDGYDDILVGSACVAGHLGYLFLGNEYRAYPEWFEDADIFFTAESAYTYLTNPILRYIMYNTGVRLGDLNGDGLDDVVLSIYMYKLA